MHVLAALTRLRQICAHPGLLFEEHLDDPEASAKFEAFLETVDEISPAATACSSSARSRRCCASCARRSTKRGIAYGYLDGSTKDRDRQAEVERFMRPTGRRSSCVRSRRAASGLTLTAADYVILYDPWWNPAVERQAIDRTHRIGQHRAVTAYRLVTRGTVEEKIRLLAERKNVLSRASSKPTAPWRNR